MGVIPTARVYDIYLGTYEYLSDGGENRHYRRMGVITRGVMDDSVVAEKKSN